MASKQAMSMEAMLDEERREVLALLEGTQQRPKPPSSIDGRSASPYASPRSPVRSMLDIGDDIPSLVLPPDSPSSPGTKPLPPRLAPVRSMLDVDSPPPATTPIRSMLDVGDSPPHSAAKKVFSSPSSPIESSSRHSSASHGTHPRSMSDAASRPADFGPRSSASRLDPTSNYQFGDILTNNTGNAKPKRVTQGGKRSSMAEVMRGNDVSNLMLPGDRGRHYSTGGNSLRLNDKSRSPHNRGLRSNSPGNLLHGRQMSPGARAILNDPLDIDYHNAYRRLSDAALARSGGSLSELGRRKRSDDAAGSGRLTKDYLSPDGDLLVEDSSEDNASSSEDEGERGRKTARSFGKANQKGASGGSNSPETTRTARSLLAAAEEERLHVAAQQPTYQYRSLLDEPEIKVTAPPGERAKQSKSGIHPATSFDLPPHSGTHTPVDSDTEADLTDIRRAQKLSFSMSQIIDTPESHRTIQIITRGEYSKLVQEAEDEHKRPRKYLVATDLSDESTHALEWAIGTVLRDGDTLLAIYCVDEETGIVPADGESGVLDQHKAMKDQAAAISVVANSKTPVTPGGSALPLHVRPSPLSHVSISDRGSGPNPSPAPSSRERSKATEERFRAVHDIADRVTRLLRKTRLQVKAIVEVLHCKNPKHLITEVIDLVNPTLVILGSRGRSALKGVILGSFSNYLVTKSSVPVMVARKRLRKQTKYKRLPATHQVNNINNPAARSLANAKID
ncbi:putative universal stress protein [Immersiella caudata]|uniref:Universal stress protein n=1 Tax=Immersiella caudata TaxID=314043 RepID=A0AA39WKI5_9PEZI|nr:putative universal stress protein [Immersiella caudata]